MLSAVSASQNSNGTNILEVSQDTILNSDEGEMIVENQNEILNGGSFADIQKVVDNSSDGSTIKLQGTFKSTAKKSIIIEKNITIDGGKKTVLDANGLSGFFNFKGNNNIVLTGLTFINLPLKKYGIQTDASSSGKYIIDQCNFKNNKNDLIFSIDENNAFVISNTDFTNNTRMYISAWSLKINNCNFIKNTGEIFPTSVDNCNFIQNKDSKYYGFINGAVSISNCNFKSNTNSHNSFILDCISVSNSNFIKNTLYGDSLVRNVKSVTNCKFENNAAKKKYQKETHDYNGGFGGALYNVGTVDNCVFTNNKADIAGGAIAYVKSVSNCVFKKNSALEGGAIYDSNSVINSDFSNNKAKGCGGAIAYVSVLKKCNFKNNLANGRVEDYSMAGGGAVFVWGKVKIDKCNFIGNSIKTSGSAILIDTIVKSAKVSISNSKFSKNVAKGNFETVGYLFKNYAKGTIYNIGNHNFKITFKHCKGLNVKNSKKFKLKTQIKSSFKKNHLIIKVKDKIYSNPLKGLKIKIKVGKKVYTKKTNKKGKINFSFKNRASGRYHVKITFAGNNYMLKSTKSMSVYVR